MEVSYSTTGERTVVSNKPKAPLLPFGYRLGLQDPDTGLIWLSRSRLFDPYLGQWTGPDLLGLFKRLSAALQTPESIDGYSFDHLSATENGPSVSSFPEVTRPDYWLSAFNIDAKRILRATDVVSMTASREAVDRLLPRMHRSPLLPQSVAVESVFQAGLRRRLDSFKRITGAFDFVQPSSPSAGPPVPQLASASSLLNPGLRTTYAADGTTSLTGLAENSQTWSSLPDQLRQLASFMFNGSRLLPQQAETMADGRRWLRLYRMATPLTDSVVRNIEQSSSTSGASKFSVQRYRDDSLEVRVDSGMLSATVRSSKSSVGAETNRLAVVGLQQAGKRLMRDEAASLASGGVGATRFAWSQTALQELRRSGVAVGYRPVSTSDDPLLWDDPGSVYFVPAV